MQRQDIRGPHLEKYKDVPDQRGKQLFEFSWVLSESDVENILAGATIPVMTEKAPESP